MDSAYVRVTAVDSSGRRNFLKTLNLVLFFLLKVRKGFFQLDAVFMSCLTFRQNLCMFFRRHKSIGISFQKQPVAFQYLFKL